MNGVVAGIGGYGNCIGVPTVGGEVYFDAGYDEQHPGQRVHPRPRARATASSAPAPAGVGNPVIYVGSQDRPRRHPRRQPAGLGRVRRDAEEKRPTVQVGDPFTEKLLLEACLELDGSGDASWCDPGHGRGRADQLELVEMAGRGGTGIDPRPRPRAAARRRA